MHPFYSKEEHFVVLYLTVMSKQPVVSVIVTTKNSSKTLRACLESIKQQTFKDVELVLVDNYSADDTLMIAQRYTKHVFSKGPERSTQRNFAVEKATGSYVCIIDSDMELAPTIIAECVDAMKEKGAAGVIIPEESFGKGFWAKCKQLERSYYVGIPYMEAARFFKRSDYLDVGGYDESMVSGEDWDLSQRIEQLGSFSRTDAYIYHNEGKISLWKTIKKKFYYASKFASYTKQSSNKSNVGKQTSIIGRYKLFLSKPGKLFKNPVIGLGMLFMKTCEFLFGGIGLLLGRLQK